MSIAKITLVAAAIALGGCTISDPNSPTRNTEGGALIGAGLGALIGASTGGHDRDARRSGAVLGAIIGGGLGALGGADLDRQAAELRSNMGSNVGVVNTGEQLIVTLPQDILFATDSASLTGGLQSDLRALADSINRYPNTTINVVGHTDNVGTASYNQALSTRRAQAVANVLSSAGVNYSRISAYGQGEDYPVTTNLTSEGRAENRRVEIVIIPN